MTLTQYRKELKKRGYKLSIKTLSFGKAATYTHIKSDDKLNYNVFTEETVARWKPLFDYIEAIKEELEKFKISGLKGV